MIYFPVLLQVIPNYRFLGWGGGSFSVTVSQKKYDFPLYLLFQDCLAMITKSTGHAHTGTNPWSEKVFRRRFFILSKFLCAMCEKLWNVLTTYNRENVYLARYFQGCVTN